LEKNIVLIEFNLTKCSKDLAFFDWAIGGNVAEKYRLNRGVN